MNYSFKYVCLDLDGTLLNSSKEISAVNSRIIKELQKKGIRFFIATGRHLDESLAFLKRYDLEKEFDFIVYADGSQIFDIRQAHNRVVKLLSKNDLKKISTITGCKDYVFYEEDNDYFVFSSLSKRSLCKFLRNNTLIHRNKNRYIYYPMLFLHKSKSIEKVVLPLIPPSQKATLSKSYQILENSSSLEVLPTDKCRAIQQVMHILKESYDKLLYMGDEFNDLSCFESFPSVVMGNAPKELHRFSIIEAKSNDDDGVADALVSVFSSSLYNNL